jgi:hypothetical protein
LRAGRGELGDYGNPPAEEDEPITGVPDIFAAEEFARA